MAKKLHKKASQSKERLALLKCWIELLGTQKQIHDRYLGTVKSIEKLSILSWEICHGYTPSASDLARELDLPRESARRLLNDLVTRGMLESKKSGKRVVYHLLPAGECIVFAVFDQLIDTVVEIRRKHGLPTDYIEHMRETKPLN